MKKSLILIFLTLFALLFNLQAQEIKGKSSSYSFYITKDPPKPPYLEIVDGSLEFLDSDGNRMIDANESTSIRFMLKNTGYGPGLSLKIRVKEMNSVPGLLFDKEKNLGTLEPGATKTVEIPISSKMNTVYSKAIFEIRIDEANDFGTDPVVMEVPTREFISPEVEIVDYKVTSQSGTTLQKKRPFEVQVMVQNVGQGNAENVKLNLPVPQDMFCLSDNAHVNIGLLKPGEATVIEYSLVANNNYTAPDIPLKYNLSERYLKYSKDRTITLTMNQVVSDTKLVIEGKKEEKKDIAIASLTSAVDKNIPFSNFKNPNRLALIIGNENYSQSLNAEINVGYARNDAEIFRQYAVNLMGVNEDNVYFLTDATAGTMRSKIELVSKLLLKMGNRSELIFYYAGHGLPDENTRIPYLIPVDVNATNLSAALKLSDIYQKFSRSGAARITVFLDACFSGGGRNQGLLAARGVKIKPQTGTLNGNMVVFTASSGEQSALPYKDEKHGMFTYFLLKKLQETKGNVSYGELADYLEQNVSVESLRKNGKEQDPEVNTSLTVQDSWKYWQINK